MWIITNKGFLSIVKKKNSYVIRSRTSEVLEHLFPDNELEHNIGTDYEFRVIAEKLT